MNKENWIIDGRVGTAWIVYNELSTELLAARIKVEGPITLAQRIADLLNLYGSKS